MSDFSKIQKRLERLGLSENQATIYLLLLQKQEMRVQEIVRLANMPRSSVYESLRGLFAFGLAEEIVQDSFKTIRAYPITSMKHVLDEKIIGLQKMTVDLASLEKSLVKITDNSTLALTSVRYYKGIAGARQLLWNTLKAQSDVCVYSAWGRGRYVGIKFYQTFVTESQKRQVRERVLINPATETLESIRRHTGSSISRTNPQDIRVLDRENIVIRGETFIYDNVYAQVYLKDKEITGFEIESLHFTDTQRSIFETLWNLAEPVSKRL